MANLFKFTNTNYCARETEESFSRLKWGLGRESGERVPQVLPCLCWRVTLSNSFFLGFQICQSEHNNNTSVHCVKNFHIFFSVSFHYGRWGWSHFHTEMSRVWPLNSCQQNRDICIRLYIWALALTFGYPVFVFWQWSSPMGLYCPEISKQQGPGRGPSFKAFGLYI